MPAAYSVGATGNLRRVAILDTGGRRTPRVPEFKDHFGRMLWDEQCGTGTFQLLSGRRDFSSTLLDSANGLWGGGGGGGTPPPSAGAGMARTSPAPAAGFKHELE